MPKFIAYILLTVFLFCTTDSFAQPVEDVIDTVVVAKRYEATDSVTFDLVLRQEPVQVRPVPEKRLDSLKADDNFWYANAVPEKTKAENPPPERQTNGLLQQQWFRDLLWVIVLCSFIGIVLWYLASSNLLIFRKSARNIAGDEAAVEEEDDIFSLPYERDIANAEAAGNFRLAVRLWYLRTLKELADRKLIDYRYGRTNSDYVMQLYNTAHYRSFFQLTRTFDYTWYGQFEPSAEAYAMMRNNFLDFKNGLR